MCDEISFKVDGYPPAKSEALSMLGVGHRHADRVVRLLEAAREAAIAIGFDGFGPRPVGLEMAVYCERDGNRSDATNYLGGVGDVLEGKAHRGAMEHLGALANVAVYDNDRQIEQVRYRWVKADRASYTVRLWALDSDGIIEGAGAELETPASNPATPNTDERPRDSSRFARAGLEAQGFEGWLTFAELREGNLAGVPSDAGVYVVWRAPGDEPAFLDANPGGRFKGKDPTVAADDLRANWVADAEVVYIGKANSLKRRLREFERFGAGAPIGHWGGRLMWQLVDSVDLQVAWMLTPGADPRAVEAGLIIGFRETHGQPPFANDPHLLGR
jgi:hypothetical protein